MAHKRARVPLFSAVSAGMLPSQHRTVESRESQHRRHRDSACPAQVLPDVQRLQVRYSGEEAPRSQGAQATVRKGGPRRRPRPPRDPEEQAQGVPAGNKPWLRRQRIHRLQRVCAAVLRLPPVAAQPKPAARAPAEAIQLQPGAPDLQLTYVRV